MKKTSMKQVYTKKALSLKRKGYSIKKISMKLDLSIKQVRSLING